MSNSDPVDHLRGKLAAVAAELGATTSLDRISFDRPPRVELGDYSTNAALVLTKEIGSKPRDVAERLAEGLKEALGEQLDRVEIAGPGFVNLFLTDSWYQDVLRDILDAGDQYGAGGADPAERILIEFVSANPTGPLTAAGGRHAAYGDSLARILTLRGHEVGREYYLNDFGSQVDRLGESIRARARGEAPAEDGYQGDYVQGLADRIDGADSLEIDELSKRGLAVLIDGIKASVAAYRVTFDVWFSESSLHEGEPNAVEHALQFLRDRGLVFETDGAVWMRTTDFGDDKDRVLVRSSGEHTYFARDIAYHLNRIECGWDHQIDVWGADHHGYVGRMRAAFAALGGDPEKFEPLIMQFVNIIERGERASMSKRRGDFVTLDDLVADIGVDAARFFMLQRSHDTTVDLDLDVAREQSNENPVYYIQYAHARIASILRKAEVEGKASGKGVPAEVLVLEPAERELIKKLAEFPEQVAEAADRRAPHRIATYALELAQTFTAFYRDCQVVGIDSPAIEQFRVALSQASQQAIARSLDLLGVSAPQEM